jgi:glycerol-3-phosphate responsive antiterminator|tara:strand:+ start:1550 stop:1750 length:201 start_codon:yes stop_codon:yes gene_type:complete
VRYEYKTTSPKENISNKKKQIIKTMKNKQNFLKRVFAKDSNLFFTLFIRNVSPWACFYGEKPFKRT